LLGRFRLWGYGPRNLDRLFEGNRFLLLLHVRVTIKLLSVFLSHLLIARFLEIVAIVLLNGFLGDGLAYSRDRFSDSPNRLFDHRFLDDRLDHGFLDYIFLDSFVFGYKFLLYLASLLEIFLHVDLLCDTRFRPVDRLNFRSLLLLIPEGWRCLLWFDRRGWFRSYNSLHFDLLI
jgi:hypothetical protein